jgi:hypothetical protein
VASANVILAPQLFDSIAELEAKSQVAVIEFIKTFQANPAHPSLKLERLNRARSKDVWSSRVGRDVRAILYKDGDTWAMLHVGHHDAAYDWAERREVGRHSVTGALQIVEAVETIREIEKVIEILVEPTAPPIFEGRSDAYLLSLGVPENWIQTLRQVKDEDQLLVVCEKLPQDVEERLLTLATGELVTPPTPVPPDHSILEAPDTRRRFFVVEDAEEMAAALEAPLDRWIAFLHPSQRDLVDRTSKGPSKVSGSAGTGKTVVAMHRARHLARAGEKVLLTSFVSTLCENTAANLKRLCSPRELERIIVSTVHKQALAVVNQVEPRVRPASEQDVRGLLDQLRIRFAPAYEKSFVEAEWDNVVRLQGLDTWDEYRGARRTGRGKGLPVKERKILWRVFGGTLEGLKSRKLLDWTGLCRRAEQLLRGGSAKSPYGAVIVDEVQDLRPRELQFLKALCAENPGNLMLCGDAGQRIYPGGFSLGALGIDVRGRSTVLRINYRTTEQIRRLADRMLGDVAEDMDGGEEKRTGTRSLLRGPHPHLVGYAAADEELAAGVAEVKRWMADGLLPEEISIFGRTNRKVEEISEALTSAGIPCRPLSDSERGEPGFVQIGTMHRAKGLEFKAVLVAGCDDRSMPNAGVLRAMEDPQDREAAEAREKRLLYVAMTRARDELTVSWTGMPSRFLTPLIAAETGETE